LQFLHENVAATTQVWSNMSQATFWWVAAGAVIALEWATGTFYLLMLSAGLVAAALATYLGASSSAQWMVAAVVGGGLVVIWRSYRKNQPPQAPASTNPDVNLDVGSTVRVDAWAADGTASVRYRGAHWDVSLLPGETGEPGNYTIAEVIGSRLIVKKV